MKKYIITMKLSLQRSYAYRGIEIIWIIMAFIVPLIFISLWINNPNGISGMNISEIATYYLIFTVISQFVMPHIDETVSDNINSGDLNFYLVKPYIYLLSKYFEEIASKFTTVVLNVLPIILFSLTYRSYIFLPSITFKKVITTILLCFISHTTLFILQFIFGSLSFFITETRCFRRVFFMISDVFTGKFFPLILMPNILQFIGKLLPFQYFWYFPTMYFLDKNNLIDFKYSLFQMIFWLFLLFVFCLILWKKGLKYYTAYGG